VTGNGASTGLLAAILDDVGFNPFRQRRRSYADYLMVAAALVICVGLVVWAAVG
jgi:hypothetical protein